MNFRLVYTLAIGACSLVANTFETTIIVLALGWVALFNLAWIEKTFININTMEIRLSSEWSDRLIFGYKEPHVLAL